MSDTGAWGALMDISGYKAITFEVCCRYVLRIIPRSKIKRTQNKKNLLTNRMVSIVN